MKKASLCVLAIIMSIIFSTQAYCGERIETVPEGSSFKPYMSYEKITNKSSRQYFLQQFAETDIWGLRKLDGRYMIAMGSYYSTKIGVKIDLVLDNGKVLECVLADSKANKDTDSTNRVGRHNDAVEFIVDTDILHDRAKHDGDISSIIGFEGCVKTAIIQDTVSYFPSHV